MNTCAICHHNRATRTVIARDANNQRMAVGVCTTCAEDGDAVYDYGRATVSHDDSKDLAYARERW